MKRIFLILIFLIFFSLIGLFYFDYFKIPIAFYYEKGLTFPLKTYHVGNVTFEFKENLSECSAKSNTVGCVPFWYENPNPEYYKKYMPDVTVGLINKTVWLINHGYGSYDNLKHLCNHELCHIYMTKQENVCTSTPKNFWECEELIEMVKNG